MNINEKALKSFILIFVVLVIIYWTELSGKKFRSTAEFKTAKEFIQALNGEIEINNQISKPVEEKSKKKAEKKGQGFSAIAGMQELKDTIKLDVIDALNEKERYAEYGLTIPNGMLLYGPPGCGKTFFAEKMAEEIGFKFNADKILFALRNYYDTENLETLYYLMLINEEFNMMDSKKEFFAMKSKRFFDDNQIWADVLLSDMYYISEILLKADYEDDNLPHQIKELLMDIKITAIESDKELYIYVKLARIYDLNIDKEKLATKIDEFFLEGKSFFHDSRYKKVNLFSTYRMIYLKSMYSLKIDQKELSSIHSFIESLATNYGGYFMTSTYGNNYFKNFSTNFSFESCYYGYEIVDLIRNM